MKHFHVFDLEVYPNYFLALFYNLETEQYDAFKIDDLKELKAFLGEKRVLIGYNSFHYDSPILQAIVDGGWLNCH